MSGDRLGRKTIDAVRHDAATHGLRPTLGPVGLVSLGIGCILGAGVFVLTGSAAANHAGPAVMLSFALAGFTCALVALCYAELASALPVAGSSYAYCYVAMGEVAAWVLGWLLLLELTFASSALAVGFSGYLRSLLADLAIVLPAEIVTPAIKSVRSADGLAFAATGGVNVVAVGAIAVVAALLSAGVRESTFVNNVMVAIKVAVLLAFIGIGATAVDPANWSPLIPASEGPFRFGWEGVFRGASILFFAYIGFEMVSTAAYEAKNPQRDLPIGILGSLAVCTVIYMAVAAVLTGIVPYTELNTPDPIAVAADRMRRPEFAIIVKVGALLGISSVLLVNSYGQSRLGFAMSRDGLLPGFFGALHGDRQTPSSGTFLFAAFSAVMAATLPIDILGDLVSVGVALAFSIVCICLMWLRSTQPDLPRPFRVPFGGVWFGRVWIGFVPALAVVLCWVMIVPVALDIVGQAARGDVLPATILGGYFVVGIVIYALYGRRSARGVRERRAAAVPVQ